MPAAGKPRGSVVVSPGRTEPIEKYFEVAKRLADKDLTVLIHDWRGHGLSFRPAADGRAGHAAGYRDFVTDFATLLEHFESRLPRPWIALGHSMGGCLTLLALCLGEDRFSGAVLSAPMLGLQTGSIPPFLAKGLSRVLGRAGFGDRTLTTEPGAQTPFESNVLTHDAERYRRNLEQIRAWPSLDVGGPTWGWLDFAFTASQTIERAAERVALPLTIVAAGEERLVDNSAIARVSAKIGGARLVTAAGAFHEILQETDCVQAVFWAEFDALCARAGLKLA